LLVKIYLDACCLSRLTDDQSQPRVSGEAKAVEKILRMVRQEFVIWISSSVLSLEISRNPDTERRRGAEALLTFAHEIFIPDSATADLAQRIERLGITSFDALHLASADQSGADVFLTTDDNLLRRARRGRGLLRIRAQNPVSWLREVQS
jgi:predicted nucleic acid-binding protein